MPQPSRRGDTAGGPVAGPGTTTVLCRVGIGVMGPARWVQAWPSQVQVSATGAAATWPPKSTTSWWAGSAARAAITRPSSGLGPASRWAEPFVTVHVDPDPISTPPVPGSSESCDSAGRTGIPLTESCFQALPLHHHSVDMGQVAQDRWTSTPEDVEPGRPDEHWAAPPDGTTLRSPTGV